jgi:RNA polymerase sigma-70 factor, ECF subfamily
MDGMTLAQGAAERTDEMLAGAAQAGDQEAFAILVERYRDVALAYAFACLGSREEAEDAAQEAFVRAYLSLMRFRASESWGAWLMRILRNHCTDLVRRRKSRVPFLLDADLPDPLPLPEDAVFAAERRRELAAALAKLPDKYRIPLTMYYASRRTYREIALALDLPESTITGRLALGLRRMRRTLGVEDEQ